MTNLSQTLDATTNEQPAVRRIGTADLKHALRRGWQDFLAAPTQLIFLCVIYPIVGLVFGRAADGGQLLPLLFPLIAGFALVGPLAALGVYELSRRREAGLPVTWLNAFDVRHSPAIGSIAALGAVLMVIFVAWLIAARVIWQFTMGGVTHGSIGAMLTDVLNSPQGTMLILLGNGVGFLFAVVVLAITVVSFPLLLDRNVGVAMAVGTSIRAVLANPVTMALWGLTVAVLLALGSLPLFIGLAVVMPVLGHATWHLYRKVVV